MWKYCLKTFSLRYLKSMVILFFIKMQRKWTNILIVSVFGLQKSVSLGISRDLNAILELAVANLCLGWGFQSHSFPTKNVERPSLHPDVEQGHCWTPCSYVKILVSCQYLTAKCNHHPSDYSSVALTALVCFLVGFFFVVFFFFPSVKLLL